MSVRVEIWELTGPYWSLPLRVVWYAQLAEVRVGCGASLTAKMRQVAEERLASIATRKGTIYWTDQQRLEQVAQRFWGEDPEDVIQWVPQRTDKVPVRTDYQPDEFVKAYCRSPYAICHDTLIVNVIWISLCKFMLHWLLGEKKTLNLIFAELNAFCLRKNWAGAAAKNEHDRYKEKKVSSGDYLCANHQSMIDRGVADYLVSRPVTAFDTRTRTLTFTLDCRTTEAWNKTIQTLELARVSQTRGGYMNAAANQLRSQLQEVLKSYAHYLKESSRPNATVSQDFVGGKDRKRKRKTRRRAHAKAAGPWDAGIILRSSSEVDPEPKEPRMQSDFVKAVHSQ